MYIPLPGCSRILNRVYAPLFIIFQGLWNIYPQKQSFFFSFPSHIVYNRDNGYYEPGRDIRRGKQEISAYQGGTYAKRNMDIQEK